MPVGAWRGEGGQKYPEDLDELNGGQDWYSGRLSSELGEGRLVAAYCHQLRVVSPKFLAAEGVFDPKEKVRQVPKTLI